VHFHKVHGVGVTHEIGDRGVFVEAGQLRGCDLASAANLSQDTLLVEPRHEVLSPSAAGRCVLGWWVRRRPERALHVPPEYEVVGKQVRS
jgi:hypothetical protein